MCFIYIETGDSGHIAESHWCQVRLIGVLPKTNQPKVKVLWNAITDYKGYAKKLICQVS